MRVIENISDILKATKFFVVFCYDIDTIVLPRTKASVELLWLLPVYSRIDHVAYSL